MGISYINPRRSTKFSVVKKIHGVNKFRVGWGKNIIDLYFVLKKSTNPPHSQIFFNHPLLEIVAPDISNLTIYLSIAKKPISIKLLLKKN